MSNFYDHYVKDAWREPDFDMYKKFSLAGKVGMVTGGGGGIGRNTAAAWAAAGADVALVDIPCSKERLEKLAAEMSEKFSVKVEPFYCDVSEPEQVAHLRKDLVDKMGTIDVAHINAGVCLMGDDVDVPLDVWNKTVAINLTGAHLTGQLAQQVMREHGHGGSIIFTSSLSGYNANFIGGGPSPVYTYGATKAAISQLARYMGAALAPHNIRVNTISPGYVWSGIHEGVMNEQGHDMCLEVVPIKRFGLTEDLQGALLFLASDASAYVTGINIPIDGGYSIY